MRYNHDSVVLIWQPNWNYIVSDVILADIPLANCNKNGTYHDATRCDEQFGQNRGARDRALRVRQVAHRDCLLFNSLAF